MKSIKFLLKFVALLYAISFIGCATVMHGTSQDILVNTIPAPTEKPLTFKQTTPQPNKNTVTVTWTFAPVRSGSGNNYPVVATVKQGDRLIVIGEYMDWFNVRLESGQQGWISNLVVEAENIYTQPLKKDVQALKKHTFEIGPEISYRTYKEPRVMKEEGWMYGLVGSYTYHNKLMLRVEGRGNWGEVDYSSHNSGEVDGIDDYMLEGRGLVGYDFLIAQVHSITPYIGVGYRYLNDDISGKITTIGLLGYEREANYLYSPIGLEANVQLGNKFYLKGITEFDYFWRGWQKSHLSDTMLFPFDIENTQENGYGLRGYIGFLILTKKIDFEAGPFIIYWNIKESDIDHFGFYEPKNNTTEIGFKITARF